MDNIFSDSVIGTFSFNLDTIDFSKPLFLESNEYLPISSLIGNSFCTHFDMSKSTECDSKDKKIATVIKNALPGIDGVFRGLNIRGKYNHNSISNVLEEVTKCVINYLTASPNIGYSFDIARYSRTSYNLISNSFFQSRFTTYYLQSMRSLISGVGTMITGTNEKIIMGIVFRTDLLKYHKLYYLINGTFDYANMEFWINCDIDTPQYPYKGFRKMYRNIIKPRLTTMQIPIVEKGDVDASLRSSFQAPQNSITELMEWKDKLLADFLDEEAEKLIFQF